MKLHRRTLVGCLSFITVAIVLTGFVSPVIAQPFFGGRVLNRKIDRGPVESANFVVYAQDRVLAAKVSQAAEGFRKTLAAEWLGRELPAWRQKCPIRVTVEPQAGGETSFAFQMDAGNQGVPVDWDMKIFGPPDRLLDAVLPHEITHTIFATHFGRPLPRWADEGACTTVEHVSERNKNHHMLINFLSASPSRGIPFNRMFTMKQYPHDILPLYAQGYSLAKFLIYQNGKRHFLNYIGQGLSYEDVGHPLGAWNRATSEFYDFDDLSDLQVAWIGWVKKGSNQNAAATLAKNEVRPPRDMQASLKTDIAQAQNSRDSSQDDRVAVATYASAPLRPSRSNQVRSLLDADAASSSGVAFAAKNDSWYASQMQQGAAGLRSAAGYQATITRKISSGDERVQQDVVRDSRLIVPDRMLR
jgi:hypothetical protein